MKRPYSGELDVDPAEMSMVMSALRESDESKSLIFEIQWSYRTEFGFEKGVYAGSAKWNGIYFEMFSKEIVHPDYSSKIRAKFYRFDEDLIDGNCFVAGSIIENVNDDIYVYAFDGELISGLGNT